MKLALLLAVAASLAPAHSSADSSPPRRVPVALGWFGDFVVHPGVRVGTEFPLVEGRNASFVLEPALGGYRHPGHSIGLLAESLATARYAFDSGFGLGASAGAGYLHLIPDGRVFSRGADGVVRESGSPGRPALMVSAAVTFSWDFGRSGGAPVSLFLRPRVFWHAPHDGGALGHVAGELGFTYRLSI